VTVYDTTIDADSPSAHWKLAEASGNFTDRIASKVLTPSGTVSYAQTGLLPEGNGSDTSASFAPGHASRASSSDLISATAFSVEAWVKPTTANTGAVQTVILKGDDSAYWTYGLELTNIGRWNFYLQVTSQYNYVNATDTVAASDGGVYHVVGTYDGSNIRLYVNGSLVAGPLSAVLFSTGAPENSAPFTIAGQLTTNRLPGIFDEVAYYPTALSAARVLAHYEAGTIAAVGDARGIYGVGTYGDAIYGSSGGLSATLGQLTETDTPQSLTRRKQKTLGLVTETDTPQPLTRRRRLTLNQLTETDTPQPVARRKLKGLLQTTEADTAQALGERKLKTLGLSTETDTAQPITAQLQGGDVVLGQQSETDTTQPLGRRKQKELIQQTEIDTPQPLTRRKQRTLGLIVESVTLFSVGRLKQRSLGQMLETDTAFGVHALAPARINLGLVTELDSFPPEGAHITARKLRGVGQQVEADSVLALVRRKQKTLGLIVEADILQPVTLKTRMTRTLSLLVETGTPHPLFIQRGPPLEPRPRYHVGTAGSRVIRRAGR
jgi:Concanavalin A-like lectin/glucanases superfamily